MLDIGERYIAELEAELRANVPEGGDARPFYDMLRYHLGWLDPDGRPVQAPAGKRIRPILCLLVCAGYGADFRRALPAAAAIELLHNFTLIHDDVQDRSDERRHRPTVWRLWGEAQAINAGDAMYALARLALLQLADRGVADNLVVAAAGVLDRTCLRICEGQYLDIEFERRLAVSHQMYAGMIERKTAALVGCATEMGALIGGAGVEQQEIMRQLGETLGVAYQVQDDILGIWGDPRVTGKPAADDIRGKKKTLPIVSALEHGSPLHREQLRSLLGQTRLSEAEVAEVLQILEAAGARRFAEEEAARQYQNTLHWLAASSVDEQTRENLTSLVRSLLQRPS